MEKKDAPSADAAASEAMAMQDLLLETAGRCVAFEFALKVLIETHPEPQKLAAAWREHSEELIEAALRNHFCQRSRAYSTSMNTSMANLGQALRG